MIVGASHESIRPIEAARGWTLSGLMAQMPLPGHQRAIARRMKMFGQRSGRRQQKSFITGSAALRWRQEFGHRAKADAMAVDPGHQHCPRRGAGRRGRSEEHTSELQSLMRISYAVFCLKKKKH